MNTRVDRPNRSRSRSKGPLSNTVEPAIEQRTVEILGFNGLDYLLAAGLNRDGKRVLMIGLRVAGSPDPYRPAIEMDLEFANYYRDVDAGLKINPDKPPPRPE
jgi:hypothetical protein